MSFKIIGAILALSACGFCGFLTAMHHVSHIRLLEDLIRVLEFMICQLQYRATPLPLLCRQAGEHCSGKLRQILLCFSDELEAQISPNIRICMSSVLDKLTGVDSAMAEVCIELGNQLGQFDLQGQIQDLENCKNHYMKQLEQLNQNKDNRIRSYQTLGLCAGAAIAILFV